MRRSVSIVLVALGLLVAPAPARAFYWFDWPGSGIPRVPSLIETPRPGDPLPQPPAGRLEPGPGRPEVPIDSPGGPNHVPEPATALLALVGALAARRLRK